MQFVCKFCGMKRAQPAPGNCIFSPHKSHEFTEARSQFVCRYCGQTRSQPFAGHCIKSPHGHHELMC